MTDPAVQRFLDAQTAFASLVDNISVDQWSNSTPCPDWNVRALVNHIVGEQLWAEPMLTGKTIEEVGDQYEGDLLGDDPASIWREAAKASAAAFKAPGALDGTIHSSMGPSPAAQYASEMTGDLIAHRWDLGQGIGQEQHFTDAELEQLEAMSAGFAPIREQLTAAGIFGPVLPTDDSASRQTKVLAAMGRTG